MSRARIRPAPAWRVVDPLPGSELGSVSGSTTTTGAAVESSPALAAGALGVFWATVN